MEDIITNWMPQLLSGFGVTLAVTGLSLLFGLPLGIVFAFGMLNKIKVVQYLFIGIVEFGRGVPLLVLLYLIYFGFPTVGVVWSSFVVAVVAITFNTAAYTSEIFRAGILNVPRGHIEAAHALGLSSGDERRFVVLPQAIRLVIGPIVAYSIIIFQGTSLGYAISLPEVLNQAYQIGSVNFQYLAVFTIAGLMYAVVSIIVSRLVHVIETKTALS
ncbi:amino acid ABC transporter permease [Gulosibacter sp. 10]|uniref:amino acid ABC transporter permease n=1 Tax=Gulosibacter sp. 10 TaxID=1255570 RepID=UPI00097EACA7|nr:amino acid ABC transporter permease [Gulosibacter sp. 10]SJM67783.1 Amino acid ABC transporter, permease protein [Gulosibacter sp. 10]